MEPQAYSKSDPVADDVFIEDEDGLIGGYTKEELDAVLQEAEESGLCEQSLDEIFEDLFLKHFGRKPTREERSADLSRSERF